MSKPTSATVSTDVAAPAAVVYDLIADVTRMGEWSPECRSCEWVGAPGAVGSRFKGHNKSGPIRWSTTAEVLTADRPRSFAFATRVGDMVGTRWTYTIEERGDGIVLSESFESVFTPPLIALAERLVLRNRQQQLEEGMAKTLAAIKQAAEGQAANTVG